MIGSVRSDKEEVDTSYKCVTYGNTFGFIINPFYE